MPRFADRIQETSTTSGTGDLTLAGASAGYLAFSSAFDTGAMVPYCVIDGTSWEVGIGQLTSSSTLSRLTVLASSNAGALVSFSSASKTVFNTIPATLARAANTGRQVALARGMALP